MWKAKKDLISIYMLRNIIGTFVVTFVSFMISFIGYYDCGFLEVLKRIFIFDIYTTSYFILLWFFDYILFEISKILYDLYEEKVTFIPTIILLIIGIMIYFVDILDVFQYNLSLLCLLIIVRMVKEMYKRTPQLFRWMKKRPDSGLK